MAKYSFEFKKQFAMPYNVFLGCNYLESVVFSGNNVEYIEDEAFSHCPAKKH